MDTIQFPAAEATAPASTFQAQSASARTRTKAPYRVVPSDDCVQTVNGVQYFPHVGEQVAFVASVRLDTLLMAMRLQGIQDMNLGALGKEDAGEFQGMFTAICKELAECIRGWSWTSDEPDGEGGYVSLPWTNDLDTNIATLRGRTMDEIMWLVGAAFSGGVSSGDPAGNATGA